MQVSQSADISGPAFEPLLEIALAPKVFSSDWGHCDRIATYVARMVSHNRTDSLHYANLFSSAFNELLETAFRYHDVHGELGCAVSRAGPVDRIELTIPCDDAQRGFYRRTVASLDHSDVAERYVHALLAEGPLDPGIGLLELAVDYQAQLLLDADGERVRLIADLRLEAAAA